MKLFQIYGFCIISAGTLSLWHGPFKNSINQHVYRNIWMSPATEMLGAIRIPFSQGWNKNSFQTYFELHLSPEKLNRLDCMADLLIPQFLNNTNVD